MAEVGATMTDEDDGIHFSALLSLIREHRTFIWRAMVLVFCSAVAYLHFASYTYSVKMLVGPTKAASGSTNSSSLSSIASLVGLGGQGGSDNLFSLYKGALHSPLVAASIVRQPEIMHLIFSSRWSEADQAWKRPNSVRRAVVVGIERILGIPVVPWAPPGVADVQAFLDLDVGITDDRRTPLLTVSLEWYDPVAATKILSAVHQSADVILRQQALERAENYTNYAMRELETANGLEYRQALAALLVQQEQQKMMASADLPFTSQQFGPAIASIRPTSPPASALIVLSLPAGFFFAVFLLFLFQRLGWDERELFRRFGDRFRSRRNRNSPQVLTAKRAPK